MSFVKTAHGPMLSGDSQLSLPVTLVGRNVVADAPLTLVFVLYAGAVSAAGALRGSDALLTLNTTSVSPAASSIHPKTTHMHTLSLSPQTLSAAMSTLQSPMADAMSASFAFGDGSDWSDLDNDQEPAKMLYAVRKDRMYFSPQDVDSSEDDDQATSERAGTSRDR